MDIVVKPRKDISKMTEEELAEAGREWRLLQEAFAKEQKPKGKNRMIISFSREEQDEKIAWVRAKVEKQGD